MYVRGVSLDVEYGHFSLFDARCVTWSDDTENDRPILVIVANEGVTCRQTRVKIAVYFVALCTQHTYPREHMTSYRRYRNRTLFETAQVMRQLQRFLMRKTFKVASHDLFFRIAPLTFTWQREHSRMNVITFSLKVFNNL